MYICMYIYIYIYPQTRVSSFPGLISVARLTSNFGENALEGSKIFETNFIKILKTVIIMWPNQLIFIIVGMKP